MASKSRRAFWPEDDSPAGPDEYEEVERPPEVPRRLRRRRHRQQGDSADEGFERAEVFANTVAEAEPTWFTPDVTVAEAKPTRYTPDVTFSMGGECFFFLYGKHIHLSLVIAHPPITFSLYLTY